MRQLEGSAIDNFDEGGNSLILPLSARLGDCFIHCNYKIILFADENLTIEQTEAVRKREKRGDMRKKQNRTYWSSDSMHTTGSSESSSTARLSIEVK